MGAIREEDSESVYAKVPRQDERKICSGASNLSAGHTGEAR